MPAETEKFPESPAEGDRKVIERELRRQDDKDNKTTTDAQPAAPQKNDDPHPLDRRRS